MNKKGQAGAIFAIALVVLFIALIWCLFIFRIVGYNEYAYEKEFGKLKMELKEPGIRYVGIGSFIRVNNQVRTYNIPVDAATKDIQSVNFDVNLNIQLKEEESFNFIKDYQTEESYFTYMNSKIQEKAKTVIYKYSAMDMIDKRLLISQDILAEISQIKELKYFEIRDVALANLEYSEAYDSIIEEKAKLDIQKEIILRQRENLELQRININSIDVDKYFKYMLIEKWDGKSSLIISDAILTGANK